MEERRDQPVGYMRRELGFHPAQTDRRQLLYRLPSNAPSSANQIARCSFEESHPPFFYFFPTPLLPQKKFTTIPDSEKKMDLDFRKANRDAGRVRIVAKKGASD